VSTGIFLLNCMCGLLNCIHEEISKGNWIAAMKIRIITIGKNKIQYLIEGEKNYLNRLKRYCPVEMNSTKSSQGGKISVEIMKEEAQRIKSINLDDALVVAVDRLGKELNTIELSLKIQNWQNQGVQDLVFLIGSAWGLDQSLIRRADFVLSLSRLTFQHDMVRMILLEQLYRCFTIIRGEKYHK
jgi:23S rRNA (pseudouridine1915-N3)-methyltransferase